MKVSPLKLVGVFITWGLLMLAISVFHFHHWLNTDHSIPEELRHYVIEKGASLSSVSKDLYRKGIIRWPTVWRYYAQYVDKKSIKAGEFRLSSRESPLSLLHRFQTGEVVTYDVTFSEGLNYAEFLAILANEEKLKKEIVNLDVSAHLKVLGVAVDHPEGWFFPDTYQYIKGDSDASILKRAHKKMQQVLEQLWLGRDENLPYQNSYEALIMASIIEKETGAPSERQEIAGVFVRRLQKKMRLQTDPTVIYGMGESYDGNIRRKDLRTPTPYNTYVIKGLPPTPIAMPGKDAIYAALHPADGTSLYFVAKGDGYHQFSTTLAEHQAAVRKYQLKRREGYKSSPTK